MIGHAQFADRSPQNLAGGFGVDGRGVANCTWPPGSRRLGRLQIQVDPDRNMVGRLFPGPDIAVDPDPEEAVAGLRRQQQVIDANPVVFLPRAGLIVPERVLPGGVGDRPQRVGQPEAEQGLKAFLVAGKEQGVVDPGRRIMDIPGAGMTLKSRPIPAGSSASSRCFENSRSRDIHSSFYGYFSVSGRLPLGR